MKEFTPYLIFGGNCGQAVKFYANCLNAELFVMPYSSAPGDHPPEVKDKVIHARLMKKGAPILMASDDHPGAEVKPGSNNFWINISCDTRDEIENLFSALSEKGKISAPLHDAFWGSRFGMLTDQFGVNWMLNYEQAKQ